MRGKRARSIYRSGEKSGVDGYIRRRKVCRLEGSLFAQQERDGGIIGGTERPG